MRDTNYGTLTLRSPVEGFGLLIGSNLCNLVVGELPAMVKEIKKKGEPLYVCEECGFAYKEKKWAEKCQAWDEEHHTCNLEIIQHAIPQSEKT